MIRKLSGQEKDKSLAQGIVEFTLTIPVFLLLAFGLIEFSRLMFVYIAVTTASREAVRYGSAIGDNGSGVIRYMDCAGMKDAAKAIGQFAGINDADILISYDTASAGTPSCPGVTEGDIDWGDRVVVSITNWFSVGGSVPFIDLPPIPITSVARRTIMKGAVIVNEDITGGGGGVPENKNLKPIMNYPNTYPTDTQANKCNDIYFDWDPNGLWTETVDNFYLVEIGGPTLGPISDTFIATTLGILNNNTETYRLYANFVDSTKSKTLTFTLVCNNGVLTKVGF